MPYLSCRQIRNKHSEIMNFKNPCEHFAFHDMLKSVSWMYIVSMMLHPSKEMLTVLKLVSDTVCIIAYLLIMLLKFCCCVKMVTLYLQHSNDIFMCQKSLMRCVICVKLI